MPSLAGLLKPEYLFRPATLFHRIIKTNSQPAAEFFLHELPWGLPIRARSAEEHGLILNTLGVIDLPVTEVIWRLLDPGDVALDIGANIGYMTSVMLARGCQRVYCFEPNPEVFQELSENIKLWRNQSHDIQLIQSAVSMQSGKVMLSQPPEFAVNRGLSAVLTFQSSKTSRETRANSVAFSVNAVSLDEMFPSGMEIGLAKIDVEGHESSVLRGAQSLLVNGKIRDIVFEDHHRYPTESAMLLEAAGYTIFQIGRSFWGPSIIRAEVATDRSTWLPTSFLATTDSTRAQDLIGRPGWRSLQ
jgi:FkbM family methyltransferase